VIEVKNMTLTYSSGKGIFDVDFAIKDGEVTGYLGPNGAGKTTTIRGILGFMKPNQGSCSINGLDSIRDACEIQKTLGYISGEMAFFDDMNGDEFLQFMQKMRKEKNNARLKELLELFELDPRGKIKRFSKGMKQKLGIVSAFMHDPDIYVLDEPTSGLDPLMQNRFIELILKEKARGKTILMSSHVFEEVEKTCDTVIIIKDGRIVEKSDILTLKNSQRKGFSIKPSNLEDATKILQASGFDYSLKVGGIIQVFVTGENIDKFIKTSAKFNIDNFDVMKQSLEDIFMQYYGTKEDLS